MAKGKTSFRLPWLLYISSHKVLIDNASDCDNGPVSSNRNLDPCLLRTGMYDSPITHIDSHMPAIIDDITGSCLVVGYSSTYLRLGVRASWQINTKLFEHRQGKTGTVCSVCQACPSRYIRITKKLTGIINNLLSLRTATTGWFWRVRTAGRA